MTKIVISPTTLPGNDLSFAKMPGHWVLARLGKRILRPGGLQATRQLIYKLSITERDAVIEFAPGLGATARLVLSKRPASYTGVERDNDAAAFTVKKLATHNNVRIEVSPVHQTELPSNTASVVLGEAMLTMQTAGQKEAIVREAFRLLQPGGRYGIHEIACKDDLSDDLRQEMNKALASTIRNGVQPISKTAWKELMEQAGFEVEATGTLPMHLLRPKRLLEDEGPLGTLTFMKNLLLNPEARKRVLSMRQAFERYQGAMEAIYLVAKKPS